MPAARGSRRPRAGSSPTDPAPPPEKEQALHDARDQSTHGPEDTRPRVRGRSPDRSPDPGEEQLDDGPGDVDVLDDLDDLDSDIDAARGGDEEAFIRVWRALHPALLRYLRVRGDDTPEDVASETWLQVVRGLDGFVGRTPEFRAWLFTIARNRAIDAGRARARRPAVPVADVAEVHRLEPVPSAEDHAVTNDSTARALQLVATLPSVQAEMVMLRVVAGLDVADVAQLLDKKPGTVRVTVHRALKTLAQNQTHDPYDDYGQQARGGVS